MSTNREQGMTPAQVQTLADAWKETQAHATGGCSLCGEEREKLEDGLYRVLNWARAVVQVTELAGAADSRIDDELSAALVTGLGTAIEHAATEMQDELPKFIPCQAFSSLIRGGDPSGEHATLLKGVRG